MEYLNKRGIKYFVPSPDKTLDIFQIFGVGVQEEMRPCIVNRPQGTNDWLFMYFYEPVKIKVGGIVKDFPAGSLMIWEEKDGHYYGNHEKLWKHSWLHCKGNEVGQMLHEQAIVPGHPIFINNPSALENYLMIIFTEISCYKNPDRKILINLFENFLKEIKRSSGTDKKELRQIPLRMQRIKNYIDANPYLRIRLGKLAEMACLSIPHFSAEFKKTFGVSPGEYAISVKMQNARYLLLDQNLSISEIAEEVGFKNLFQFSKSFKNRFGKSPKAFRNSQKPQ